ncbi:DNA-binding SARP family transcriptional activator/tetratricopeptide (TPR) repeat protein [Kibdelosporangium banguiense]|uniref:DNA-binding SARP family transcriptional activator/tetratricopeptide (TPR) repeat protein n=1 Tax=Kibdelosporangium banguiense TaxID=1365924 RepID=A0ABS4TQZ3_9PSEU|nr:BTAD domain-containing putative transcriptional regulator [Kibdelosporangium banguiense]MBP2326834.1 DNA-binding SARP family transcriptional activator/tetratricopeptide (TPR) repeat protein [Kibdelosporangium banguiense]
MTVQMRVLGEVEVRVNAQRVDVGHARQRCVLAVLLVEANTVVTVDQLLDRVWADRPPRRSREVVSNYVSRLRRLLEGNSAGTIERRGGGYVLHADPESVDLHLYRRLVAQAHNENDDSHALQLLEQAEALWRGEAFADLETPWIAEVRGHLTMERFAAVTDRADLALRLGRHAVILPDLAARTAAHPLDERVAGQYMLALHRAGRTADALAHYRRLREQLLEELGTDPSAALRNLHQQILSADSELAPVVVAPLTVPRQLPAVPVPFVGRQQHVGQLDALLHGPVMMVAIAGAGGIGKTWLALHWAHRHAGEFPDGQLFVDLRGFSPDGQPMNPAVAVRGFLDALGVEPGRIPTDLHAQAALFRSLVAGKQMLLILDNARDSAQVLPLLPGSESCTVVVTSRTQLPGLITGRGAHHVALDVLSSNETHALLTDRLGKARITAEPTAVGELIGFCGGFPLAVSIVAGHAATRPHLPLASIAAELRDLGLGALNGTEPTASLPTVLSWSRNALDPHQAQLFALLGIAPGADISLLAAASLIGLPPTETRTVLRGLEQASLITQDARGRYCMHDLIRAYAASIAHDQPDDTRLAALRRVLDFYTCTAQTADQILFPHQVPIHLDPAAPGTHLQPLSGTPAAMAWLDTELPNLLATQHIAIACNWHRTVWQLAWTLMTFHNRRGHLHDRLAVWQAALAAADHLPEKAARTDAHRNLGRAYVGLGRYEEATGHLNHALILAEQQQDAVLQAHTHHLLARTHELQGDDQTALDHATRALSFYRSLHEPVWEAGTLNAVGWYTARIGDYTTARAHCEAALAMQRHHHNTEGAAATLDSLGWIDHRTGDHHRAIDHYTQALILFRDLGNTFQAANTLDNLAHPHLALGNTEQARLTWQEAFELYRQQGRDQDAERVQRHLAELSRSPQTAPFRGVRRSAPHPDTSL